MRFYNLAILLPGLFVSVPNVWAESAGTLETLVVTGSPAMPLASSTVELATRDQLPGLRIDSAEILQGLPGVQADSRSNYAQDTRVTLRGFGARSAFGVRGIDLSVDGVPLSTPDGQGQLSSVLLDEITSVGVLRGPVAGLYGNGAGGVIALQTSAPDQTRLGTRLSVGEDNLTRQSVTGQWRDGNRGARIQAANLETDGDRPHASAERRHAGAQVYYTSDSGIDAVLRLDTSRDPSLQDPLGLTEAQWREDPHELNPMAELFNTRKEITHRQVSLTLRQQRGEGRWQTAFWQGSRDVVQYLGFAGDAITSAGGVVDLQRDFAGANGNYNRDFQFLAQPATFTLGAEVSQMEDRRRGYINQFGVAGDLRRDELGEAVSRDIYSLLQWQPATRWQVFGGVRHSDVDFDVDDYFIVTGNPDDSGEKKFAEWSSAFGVNFLLDEHWTFFASAGRGFETPTLTETAYRNEATGLNTALDAADNRQQEVGLKYRAVEGVSVDVTVFNIDSKNEIVVDQSLNGRTTYRNAAETERRGVELASDIPLADSWSLRVSMNYLDAEYSGGDVDGNNLPGVAKENHYTQLRWQPLLDERLTLSLAARHRARVAASDDNQTFAPSSTTADIALSSQIPWENWDMGAWIKLANLTDEKYVGSVIVNQNNGRAFEPAPGRNFSAGIDVAYKF
ncbi:TonB-dependent receptor domain-containing protein [Cellvibrio sp. PSBB006]|uniref:TonB-dependent receptor family protein n=1 Tax=Cellvibrio sp. PSBB006 TaxID=1987723 RepID=UPI000B3B1D61|nr:TonB-dependent receptor [Cellvibrio sp. PSBB006]ARU29705.1 iron transporter [Cellvibrio sp. PSBB006]